MHQTVAIVLPLPVALALVVLLLVLVVLSAIALSVCKPIPIRFSLGTDGRRHAGDWSDKAACHSAYLYVDDVDQRAGPGPRV